MTDGAIFGDAQQQALIGGRSHARDRTRFAVAQLSQTHRLRNQRQLRQCTRHANLLTRSDEPNAKFPTQPVRAGNDAKTSKTTATLELPKQPQKAIVPSVDVPR